MKKRKERIRLWENIFTYATCLSVFLVPVAVIPALHLDFEIIKVSLFRIAVMTMLLALGMKVLIEQKVSFPKLFSKRESVKFFLFLLFVMGMVWFFSVSKPLSFWGSYFRMQGLYTQIHYLLFFLLLSLGLKTKKDWGNAFSSLFAGSAICLIYGLLQALSLDPLNYNLQELSLGRIFSFLGHPNYFASYILLIMFPLISRLFNDKSWHIGVITSLALVALLLTGSRAGFLGLIAGFGTLSLLGLLIFKNGKLWFSRIVFGLVCLGLLVVFSPLSERMQINEENLRSLNSRVEIWKASIPLLKENIAFGSGQDSFQIAFSPFVPDEINKIEEYGRMTDRAHNNLIQLLSDYGLLGLIALIWFFKILLSLLHEKWTKLAKKEKVNVIGVLSSFVAIGTAHLFGFSTTVHIMVMTFYLAYLCSLDAKMTKSLKLKESKMFLKLAIIFFCSTSILIENVFPVYADYRMAKSIEAIEKNDAQNTVQNLVEATIWNPNQDYYYYVLASVFSQLEEKGKAIEAVEKAGVFSDREDYFYYFSKGKILARDCDKECDLANQQFLKASSLAPAYPKNWLEWGKALIEEGDCESGMVKLEKYLQLLPDDYKYPGTEKYRLFYKHNPDFDEVFAYKSFCEQK